MCPSRTLPQLVATCFQLRAVCACLEVFSFQYFPCLLFLFVKTAIIVRLHNSNQASFLRRLGFLVTIVANASATNCYSMNHYKATFDSRSMQQTHNQNKTKEHIYSSFQSCQTLLCTLLLKKKKFEDLKQIPDYNTKLKNNFQN